jgi:hypothetical protein
VLEVLVRGAPLKDQPELTAELELGSTRGAQVKDGKLALPGGRPEQYYRFAFRLPKL